MTPEELKQNPITVHPNQKLDTDEGESTKDEEEFTMSQDLSEEYTTYDITTKNTEESKHTETSQVLRGVLSNQSHARTTRHRGAHIFSIFFQFLATTRIRTFSHIRHSFVP